MAVDMLKRAVWLAPMGSSWQREIVEARKGLGVTLERIRADRRSLDAFWSTAPAGRLTDAGEMPARQGDALGAATNTADLEDWLSKVLAGWDLIPAPDQGAGGRRQLLYDQAVDIARHLQGCADAIAAVGGAPDHHGDPHRASEEQRQAISRAQDAIDPEGVERRRLRALYDYLLAPAPSRTTATPGQLLARLRRILPGPGPTSLREVLVRMLKLDVVQLAFSGASQDVEQEVELVQVSARHPESLTGVQLHHFGAFYRSSWRMNDWLHGRMDGAAHLVRTLLSLQRLRQRGGHAEPVGDHHRINQPGWGRGAAGGHPPMRRLNQGSR
jgi:hypothetical protein